MIDDSSSSSSPSSSTPSSDSFDELRITITAQEREIAALRERLALLENAPTAPTSTPDTPASSLSHVVTAAPSEEAMARTSRRRMLALTGGAAAIAVGATASMVRPAAAVNGSSIGLAATTSATPGAAVTTFVDYTTTTSGSVTYLLVSDAANYAAADFATVPLADLRAAVSGMVATTPTRTRTGVAGVSEVTNGTGVVGVAPNGASAFGVWGDSAGGSGVYGSSASGTALYGRSNTGYSVYVGGAGRLGFASFLPVGPPTTGTFALRDIVGDDQGDIWVCVAAGSPGSWRRITGPEPTSGGFHPLPPTRVYDSRAENGGAGPLVAPVSRNVSVADGRDLKTGAVSVPGLVPAGAVAVTCNVTVVNTQPPGGFLTLNPGGLTSASAATINWFGAAQILNNGVTVAVDGNRLLTVVAGGSGTDFVIDVTGYFN